MRPVLAMCAFGRVGGRSTHSASDERKARGSVRFRAYGGAIMGLALAAMGAAPALAQAQATRQDAVNDVKAAILALKSEGASSTFAEMSNPNGKFTKADLYLVAYDTSGVVLAHGFNKSLVGRDLSKAKDPDGKYYIQERIEMAKSQKTFWQTYKYIDPMTHKLSLKDSYCEKANDVIIICGGVYH